MNEVLDWTEQVKGFAKRLNYSQFVLKQTEKFLPLKSRIAYCNATVCFHILTVVTASGVVQPSATMTTF